MGRPRQGNRGRGVMGRSQEGAPRQSYVYAIGDTDHRLVKIGYSNDPQRRLTNIQITCPFAVSILWQTEGGATLEDALHGHFKSYHVRGEWFEFPAGQNAAALIGQAAEAIARGVPKLGAAIVDAAFCDPVDAVMEPDAPEDPAATTDDDQEHAGVLVRVADVIERLQLSLDRIGRIGRAA